MSYCSIEDLKKLSTEAELIRLSNDDDSDENLSNVINESVLEEVIDIAGDRIDGMIERRYSTPIDNPSPTLKSNAAALAMYHLKIRKNETLTDTDINLFREAITYFERLRDGREDITRQNTKIVYRDGHGTNKRFLYDDTIF